MFYVCLTVYIECQAALFSVKNHCINGNENNSQVKKKTKRGGFKT